MFQKLVYLKKSKKVSIIIFIWCMMFSSLTFSFADTKEVKKEVTSTNTSEVQNIINETQNGELPINPDMNKFPYDKIFQLLGFGGVTGFIVGYTLKKMAKIAIIFMGLIFLMLQGLAYKNYITINWPALKADLWPEQAQRAELWGKMMQVVKTGFPYAGGFGLGFFIGIKKG